MAPVIAIGTQSFEKIRENHSFYIDKTDFIREWWENQDEVTLITRPRRFGKTLNLSMMDCFFSTIYADRADLFEGLAIWKYKRFRRIQGTYPVIFLSLAGVKGSDVRSVKNGIADAVAAVYEEHRYLKRTGLLREEEKREFDAFHLYSIDTSPDKRLDDYALAASLKTLSMYLGRYYKEKTLIFLDEYDTPLQEAYLSGYWDELVPFIRTFFNLSFKTNPYLERALLTGITRVSKESIFSDFNNLEVVTATSGKYGTSFGFTGQEVKASLGRFGLSESLERVRFWYDGFCFGGQKDIYNPWSITKYLDTGKFGTYWANTSSNGLAGRLIREGDAGVKAAMEELLEGNSITVRLEEEIVFEQLEDNTEAIFGLLLATGYLRVDGVTEEDEEEDARYQLSMTNLEVRKEFHRMIQGWFKKSSVRYNDFIKALLANDVGHMNRYMNQMSAAVFSSFDAGRRPSAQAEPERFYHGFVLGLIADADLDYRITSNRESGLGRYDVVLEPKRTDADAYVFEFKVIEPDVEKTLYETVQNALRQIEEKDYDRDLLLRGIPKERIRHYGFAFDGKKVLIG